MSLHLCATVLIRKHRQLPKRIYTARISESNTISSPWRAQCMYFSRKVEWKSDILRKKKNSYTKKHAKKARKNIFWILDFLHKITRISEMHIWPKIKKEPSFTSPSGRWQIRPEEVSMAGILSNMSSGCSSIVLSVKISRNILTITNLIVILTM